jgi:hypothetical protein
MYPGEGAIEYARELTAGMARQEAAVLIAGLRSYVTTDKRIKYCVVCAFPFRDRTKNGSSKVCGAWCRTTRKSEQKAEQRRLIALVNPPRLKKIKKYDENSVMLRVWRREVPYDEEKLEQIYAKNQMYERMGGRRKPIREVEY